MTVLEIPLKDHSMDRKPVFSYSDYLKKIEFEKKLLDGNYGIEIKEDGSIVMNHTLDEIMNPEYTRFRDLCRELSFEARRLNINPSLMFCGVAWNFDDAFKERMMRPFK